MHLSKDRFCWVRFRSVVRRIESMDEDYQEGDLNLVMLLEPELGGGSHWDSPKGARIINFSFDWVYIFAGSNLTRIVWGNPWVKREKKVEMINIEIHNSSIHQVSDRLGCRGGGALENTNHKNYKCGIKSGADILSDHNNKSKVWWAIN